PGLRVVSDCVRNRNGCADQPESGGVERLGVQRRQSSVDEESGRRIDAGRHGIAQPLSFRRPELAYVDACTITLGTDDSEQEMATIRQKGRPNQTALTPRAFPVSGAGRSAGRPDQI